MTADYQAFLEAKAQLAQPTGLPCEPGDVSPVLKPHQRDEQGRRVRLTSRLLGVKGRGDRRCRTGAGHAPPAAVVARPDRGRDGEGARVTGLRPAWPAPNALDRRQREFELHQAIVAARKLQDRLEMLGDRRIDVRIVQSLRNSLAADLAGERMDVPHG